jgi:hypothetical protein
MDYLQLWRHTRQSGYLCTHPPRYGRGRQGHDLCHFVLYLEYFEVAGDEQGPEKIRASRQQSR